MIPKHILLITFLNELAQSAGAVEYSLNESPAYDSKQSDVEVPVIQGLWGMQSTPSLPLLQDPLWPGVVALDRALYMGYIELIAYLC